MTMRRSFVSFWVLVVLSSVLPLSGGERPNVLFIAIDDLRTDLGALDVPFAKSPELDAFARSARVFHHHYVQVPTCGASRCALLRGRYPNKPAHVGNAAIAATHSDWGMHSLPAVFRTNGYRTLALGKISLQLEIITAILRDKP